MVNAAGRPIGGSVPGTLRGELACSVKTFRSEDEDISMERVGELLLDSFQEVFQVDVVSAEDWEGLS